MKALKRKIASKSETPQTASIPPRLDLAGGKCVHADAACITTRIARPETRG